MSRHSSLSIFNPQRDNPEDLEKILVKRNDLLAIAVEKVRDSVLSGSKHHQLFVGPRGMGKSYLVTLIHHRLSLQEDLAGKMRFAWLNEDQTSTTFLHLISRIYRKLAEQYPDEFPESDLDEIRGEGQADAREIIGKALLKRLGDRTTVMMIENIDAHFRNMNAVEQRTWRAFIQNHPVFTTVATAQGLTKDVAKQDKPFYGFFDLRHLEALTVDDAKELLEKIAILNGDERLAGFLRIPRGKARLQAIYHLSGGNPRLYLILSDFLTKEGLDELVKVFENTVDRQLTPYFQERMRWLSAQQQEIVQFLCQRMHPTPVTEIAEAIFAKPGTASSQLKQLRENGYVISRQRGRESLYELAEPLMRLSYQVKEANNRQPLALIVDFLRVWYDREDLEEKLAGILPGTHGRDYFEFALRKTEAEGYELRHSLMRMGLEDVDWTNCSAGQIELLKGIAEESKEAKDWFRYGETCFLQENLNEAVGALTRAIGLPETDKSIAYRAKLCRGIAYRCLLQYTEAIADFKALIEDPEVPDRAKAWCYCYFGSINIQTKEFDQAIAHLTTAIEMSNPTAAIVAFALNYRAESWLEIGQEEKAMADFTCVVDVSTGPPGQLQRALLGQGELNLKAGRHLEAIDNYSRAVTMKGGYVDQVASALLERGAIYADDGPLTNEKEALADFTSVIQLDGASNFRKSIGLLRRGATLASISRFDQAIADFLEVTASSSDSPEAMSGALLGLGACYMASGQFNLGIEALTKIIASKELHEWVIPEAAGLMVTILSLSGRHEDVFDYLDDFFASDGLRDDIAEAVGRMVVKTVVEAAVGLRDKPDIWMNKMSSLLPILKKLAVLTDLGRALVKYLGNLRSKDLNTVVLDRWTTSWERLCSEIPEMQIPLRMLRAGIEFIKTQEEGALLELVKEERIVVRQALGMDDKEDDS